MRRTAHRAALDYHLLECLAWANGEKSHVNETVSNTPEERTLAYQRDTAMAQAHSAAVLALAMVTPDPDPRKCTRCGGKGTITVAHPDPHGLPGMGTPTTDETCQRCEGTGEDPTDEEPF